MKILLPLLLLAAAPAAAQQDNREIIVTGRAKASPAEALQYVNQLTFTGQGQVARFHKPVCPMVVGLPEAVAGPIAARIRETAKGIGAEVAPQRCEANLIVIAADDIAAYLTDSRKARPGWFEGLPMADFRALMAEQSPVRAWAVVSPRNEDGAPVARNDKDEPPSSRVMSASILRRGMRLDIDGAVVLFDRLAIKGISPTQIADYAAMRGLARTRPVASESINSILSLFDLNATRPVPELTRPDILYLQSLYRSKGTESLSDARSQLARAILQ